MYYNQAQVAANWWIDKMKKRCSLLYPYKVTLNGTDFVITDDSFAEELSRFEALLIAEIQDCLETRSYLFFSCNFFPNRELSIIAKKANISRTYFPVNASMQIVRGKISVSLDSDLLHDLPLPV